MERKQVALVSVRGGVCVCVCVCGGRVVGGRVGATGVFAEGVDGGAQ